MTALAAARNVNSKELGFPKSFLAADSQTFYNGAFCMRDSAGLLRPAGALAGNTGCVGIAELSAGAQEAAGTPGRILSGTSGDVRINVREGLFNLVGATLEQDDVGKIIWALDDQTLDETAPAAAVGQSPIAGTLAEFVSATSGWVEMTWRNAQQEVRGQRQLGTIAAATIADGDQLTDWTPGFAGILTDLDANVIVAVTTAAKATTLTAEIGAVAATGSLALTSANLTPLGAIVTQALTGAVYFGPADTLSIIAGSTTTFIEGSINVSLHYAELTQ